MIRGYVSILKKIFIHQILVFPFLLFVRVIPIFISVQVMARWNVYRPLDYLPKRLLIKITNPNTLSRIKAVKKEPGTVEWIEKNMSDGDVFFDIGANVGAYSIIFASQNVNAKVFAFEPMPATFALLTHNVIKNNLQDNITAIPVALGRVSRLSEFYMSSLEAGSAEHSLDTRKDTFGNDLNAVGCLKMLSMDLDTCVDLFNLPLPNSMKIDVDGNELEVLKGAKKLLSQGVLRTILVEVAVDNFLTKELEGYLNEFGFIESKRNKLISRGVENLIFVKN